MIIFDLSIYSKEAILKAIKDYANITTIDCEYIKEKNETSHQKTEKIVCRILASEYDMELTRMEFGNYVISLTVSMGGSVC